MQARAASLFASYLLGHLVFLLGSWLDEFYDWARRYTLNARIALLARALIWLVFKRHLNLAWAAQVRSSGRHLAPARSNRLPVW